MGPGSKLAAATVAIPIFEELIFNSLYLWSKFLVGDL